jgi:hypothetical protein
VYREVGARRSAAALFVASLISLVMLAPSVPIAAASSSDFVVLSSTWASSSGEVGPGSTNAQLVVVVAYTQSNSQTATAVQVTLQLPTGFTDTSGSSAPVNGVATVTSGSTFNLKYNLTVASNVPVGTYKVGVTFDATINDAEYFETYGTNVGLLGSVILNYEASQSVLYAGVVNAINFTLVNSGTGTATQVRPSISTSVGSVVSTLPVFPSIGGGSSERFVVDIFVPASIASSGSIFSSSGSSASITFTTSYYNAYGASVSASQTVGFHTASAPTPILQFTASSSLLIPGQVNTVLVQIVNLGPGGVTRLDTTITASSGYSVLNQIPLISVLNAGSPVNETIRVFAPTSTAGSALTLTFSYSYIDPYGTSTSGSQILGFYTASTSSVSTSGTLSISASTKSLVAGEQSTVSFTITNTGHQAVHSPTFSLTVPSPLVVSSSSSLSLSNETIVPGESVQYNATISSPSSSTGGSYSGSLTVTYTDQSGNTFSQSTPVTFNLVIQIRQVSLSSSSTQVQVGGTTRVAFTISNAGNVPVYSPTISLTLPSGLAVTANSTYSSPGLMLQPGKSLLYEANVTSGPSTSEATYTGTLVVSYTDTYGNSYSQTFSPGFVLVAGIDLVIQDLSASQASGGTLTVTGTLLNEGLGSAYYLEVSGSSAHGTPGSSYVGEVDPNTPVPFSVTFPYDVSSGGSHADVQIVADYKNNYGQALHYEYSSPVSVGGSSSSFSLTGTGSQSSAGGSASADLLRYLVIIIIVVAVVASALYVRRSRRSSKGKGAKPDVI